MMRIGAIALLGVLLLSGCAPVYRYNYKVNSEARETLLASLVAGMKPAEVQAIAGPPHETYRDQFGQDGGEPWPGEVWLYFVGLDDAVESAKRYNKVMLVFASLPDGPSLVAWRADDGKPR